MARGIVGSRTVAGEQVPTIASPMFKQVFDLRTGLCLDDPQVGLGCWAVRVVEGCGRGGLCPAGARGASCPRGGAGTLMDRPPPHADAVARAGGARRRRSGRPKPDHRAGAGRAGRRGRRRDRPAGAGRRPAEPVPRRGGHRRRQEPLPPPRPAGADQRTAGAARAGWPPGRAAERWRPVPARPRRRGGLGLPRGRRGRRGRARGVQRPGCPGRRRDSGDPPRRLDRTARDLGPRRTGRRAARPVAAYHRRAHGDGPAGRAHGRAARARDATR